MVGVCRVPRQHTFAGSNNKIISENRHFVKPQSMRLMSAQLTPWRCRLHIEAPEWARAFVGWLLVLSVVVTVIKVLFDLTNRQIEQLTDRRTSDIMGLA